MISKFCQKNQVNQKELELAMDKISLLKSEIKKYLQIIQKFSRSPNWTFLSSELLERLKY
jgi:hypothetical protein